MKYIYLLFWVFFMSSCDTDYPSYDEILYTSYSKLERAKQDEMMADCRARAIEAAEIYTDSIIDQLLQRKSLDTILFPDRPMRAVFPDKILGTVDRFDTTGVLIKSID